MYIVVPVYYFVRYHGKDNATGVVVSIEEAVKNLHAASFMKRCPLVEYYETKASCNVFKGRASSASS